MAGILDLLGLGNAIAAPAPTTAPPDAEDTNSLDRFIMQSDLLRNLANKVGMQREVYIPRKTPPSLTTEEDPLREFPLATRPTDLPATVSAYRANPTNKYGAKDGLETMPMGMLQKNTVEAARGIDNKYTNPMKAVQDLYRMARLNGAADSNALAAMSPEEMAAFVLKEGRTDAGYNAFRGSPTEQAYRDNLKESFNINGRDADVLALIASKRRIAERLGIPFAEAWNGTGTNGIQTGAQYAQDWEHHLKAAQHPKNAAMMEVIRRGFEDGKKHGFASPESVEEDYRSKRKKIPYKAGGAIEAPALSRKGGRTRTI